MKDHRAIYGCLLQEIYTALTNYIRRFKRTTLEKSKYRFCHLHHKMTIEKIVGLSLFTVGNA